MVIVDSHVHVSKVWGEPVEALLNQMELNGVGHTVLVGQRFQTDNSYLVESARRYPGRFAVAVVVDTDSPSAADELTRLAQEGASGIRLRADTRSPGADPLLIWRTAAKLGIAISCASPALLFATEEFARLVQSLPDLTIVLEHLASGARPDANEEEKAARQKAFTLSRFPNVYIKFHGLGEFCRRAQPLWGLRLFEEPDQPLLEQALKAFGPQRMVWGSSFAGVGGREGYRNALRLPMERLASLSNDERDLIFGKVALSVFRVIK